MRAQLPILAVLVKGKITNKAPMINALIMLQYRVSELKVMLFKAGKKTTQLPSSNPDKATGKAADKMGMPRKHHMVTVAIPPMIPIGQENISFSYAVNDR